LPRPYVALAALTLAAAAPGARAQSAAAFQHPERGAWWLSGQLNVITLCGGPNSFGAEAQAATSYAATAYAGLQATPLTELIVHVESSAGNGQDRGPVLVLALRAHLEL